VIDVVSRVVSNDYIKSKYNGYIKISYEKGQCKSFIECNNLENKLVPVTSDFNFQDLLATCCRIDFYGMVGFKFEAGKITEYLYYRTWQSVNLSEKLGVRNAM